MWPRRLREHPKNIYKPGKISTQAKRSPSVHFSHLRLSLTLPMRTFRVIKGKKMIFFTSAFSLFFPIYNRSIFQPTASICYTIQGESLGHINLMTTSTHEILLTTIFTFTHITFFIELFWLLVPILYSSPYLVCTIRSQ